MSLIRNQRGSATNQTLTAKRFVAGEPISGDSYRPIEYIQVENGYMIEARHAVNVDSASSFIIKAEFGQNASGTLMGTATGLQIVKEGSSIKWKNGSTVLHQVAWKEGLQLYGFVRTGTGTLPYYEGEIITSATPVITVVIASLAIGIATSAGKGSDVTGDPISGSWGFRVSEVIGNLLYSYSGTEKQMTFHWYATRRSSSQAPIMFETRGDYETEHLGCITGQGRTYTAGEDVTYGMQVDDLKIAFGSPYQDLLMILTGDGGIDRQTGWRPAGEADIFNNDLAINAETFTSDNVEHKTAFYLPSSIIEGNPTVTPPTPPYGTTWEVGQLFKGRKPKWNLWNNAIKAFKYMKPVPVGSQGQNTGYKLAFNIFKDVYGRNMLEYVEADIEKSDHLLCFDGYNNSDLAHHIPFIDAGDDKPKISFFGDINYDKITEKNYNHFRYTFVFDKTASGTIKACLGNMPWWNLTKAQLDALVSQIGHTLRIFGIYATIDIMRNGNWISIANFTAITPITDSQNNPLPFCSAYINSGDADTEAAREQFQETGVESNLNYGNMSEMARLSDSGEQYTRITMRMAMTTEVADPDLQTVDCSDLLPAKLIDAKSLRYVETLRLIGDVSGDDKGIVTKTVSGETSNSIFLKEYNGGSDYSLLDREQFFQVINTGGASSAYALGIRFALVPSSVASPTENDTVVLFKDTRDAVNYRNPNYLVYVRYVSMRSWASMLGAPRTKVFVGDYDDFRNAPNSTVYYVDSNNGKIYHKVSGSYVEDENVYVTPRPETGATNKTYFTGTLQIPQRYGEDGEWHILPYWFRKGVMYGKYFGWAQPFHRYDVDGSCFTTLADNPFSIGNYNYYTPNKSVQALWKYAGTTEEDGEKKNAAAVIYLDHLHQSGANVPDQWPVGEGLQPSVVHYQVFDADNAPHSSGPYLISGNNAYVGFEDKVENYIFYENQNETGYKYVVVGDDALIAKGGVQYYNNIILAHLRLYNGDNNERTTSEFKRFRLSVYKQLPCRPFTQAHQQGVTDNYQFDSSYRVSTIFENLQITSLDTQFEVRADNKTYRCIIRTPAAIDGCYPELQGQNTKYMTYKPECFSLEVTTLGSNIEEGAKYLYRISFY